MWFYHLKLCVSIVHPIHHQQCCRFDTIQDLTSVHILSWLFSHIGWFKHRWRVSLCSALPPARVHRLVHLKLWIRFFCPCFRVTPDRLSSRHPLESLKTSSDRNINVAAVSYLFQLMHIQCPPSSLRFMSDCAGVCFSTILDNSMLNWCYQEESLSLYLYLFLF